MSETELREVEPQPGESFLFHPKDLLKHDVLVIRTGPKVRLLQCLGDSFYTHNATGAGVWSVRVLEVTVTEFPAVQFYEGRSFTGFVYQLPKAEYEAIPGLSDPEWDPDDTAEE